MDLFTFSKKSFKNSQKTFEIKCDEDGGRLGTINMIWDQKWGVTLQEIHWMPCMIFKAEVKDNLK